MNIINRGRGFGKTSTLIEESAMNGTYIVCCNLQQKKYILELAKKMNLEIKAPITYEDIYSHKYRGIYPKKISIDDADLFMQFCLNKIGCFSQIETVTLSG